MKLDSRIQGWMNFGKKKRTMNETKESFHNITVWVFKRQAGISDFRLKRPARAANAVVKAVLSTLQ